VAVLIAEVLLSLFAVFGMYAAVLLFAFRPGKKFMAAAIDLRAPMTAEEAEALLAVTHRMLLFEGYSVVALVDQALLRDEAFVALLENSVDAYYIVENKEV
jgi:hypothetical protein